MSWDVPGSVRVWVGVGFGLWLGIGGLGHPRTFDGNPGHPSFLGTRLCYSCMDAQILDKSVQRLYVRSIWSIEL